MAWLPQGYQSLKGLLLHDGFSSGGPPKKQPSHPLRRIQSPLLCVVTIGAFTTIMGDRFYNQPELSVGTIADTTIIAPETASFPDEKTTELLRQEMRKGGNPILKRDQETTAAIKKDLQLFIGEVEELRSQAGEFPFLPVTTLALSHQSHLRQLPETQWQTLLQILKNSGDRPANGPSTPLDSTTEKAVVALRNYRQQVTETEFQNTMAQVAFAREGYGQALQMFNRETTIFSELLKKYHQEFLSLRPEDWQTTRTALESTMARILTQGIPAGFSQSLLQDTLQIQLTSGLPTASMAQDILMVMLRPNGEMLRSNLVEDKEEIKKRAEQAAQAIPVVIVNAEQGMVIVEKGETITQEDFVLLDGFRLSRRRINWVGLYSTTLLVTGGVVVMVVIAQKLRLALRFRDQILLALLSLSVPVLTAFSVPYNNLATIGLLTSSFYHPLLAVGQVVILAGFDALSVDVVLWEHLGAGLAGGLLTAIAGGKLRSREEQAIISGAVAGTQGVVHLVINVILSAGGLTIWKVVLQEAVSSAVSGVAWIVLALGLSPYLERFFDLVTPIRLAELSNPNRPLLKRLALEAPGTFQHTMFVASLAEAAARELHCNVELVRAGTLYHDIGKMHDPLGFIENQMGGPNKHDRIGDPWKSAEIIKKHVTVGLEMARKCNLPKAIRDFIPEHQGTLTISFFYFQAKQKQKDEKQLEVREEDFRYDGPVPQSRETGIVMLADSCEAALRSLNAVTPDEALNMINKIFHARWRDQQLKDSGLRREELRTIAEVFVRVWQQYNHQRIAYPAAALDPKAMASK